MTGASTGIPNSLRVSTFDGAVRKGSKLIPQWSTRKRGSNLQWGPNRNLAAGSEQAKPAVAYFRTAVRMAARQAALKRERGWKSSLLWLCAIRFGTPSSIASRSTTPEGKPTWECTTSYRSARRSRRNRRGKVARLAVKGQSKTRPPNSRTSSQKPAEGGQREQKSDLRSSRSICLVAFSSQASAPPPGTARTTWRTLTGLWRNPFAPCNLSLGGVALLAKRKSNGEWQKANRKWSI
jgi:hypothetical protein